LFVALLASQAACKSLMFWQDDESPAAEPVAAEPASDNAKPAAGARPKGATYEELELKLAKTWARVDELEEEQYRQKEKLRVLEKGLTLGLLPEELEHEEAAPKKKAPAVELEAVAAVDADKGAKEGKDAEAKAAEPAGATAPLTKEEEEETYQKMLASAQDQYRAGKYGRAIVEFSEMGKTFGKRTAGGLHLYWIAKSWIGLKEYTTARQHLQEFMTEYPASPWIPRAKLDLAKVEWKLGLQETAIQRFKEIIQTHPYEDAAEMAKMELSNLDKSL
jgi:TolA-binding protein